MAPRVFFHVGPPKSGTTYLQGLLYANPEAFARAGVSVVGTHRLHYRAASELTGRKNRLARALPNGLWDQVAGLVAAEDGDVVISQERYSLLDAEDAQRVVESLADRELHVVLTLRDPVAVEPSRWQEQLKNGGDLTWQQFCARTVDEPGLLARRQRARKVLEVWPGLVPPERIHVVTVPAPGAPPEELFARFARVLGVDLSVADLAEPERSNPSLDLASSELVRRINAARPGLGDHAQRSEIKEFLANGALSRRRGGVKPKLAGEAFAVARAEGTFIADRVRELGLPVTGDLADLVSAEEGTPEQADPGITEAELLDVATEALVALANRSHQHKRALLRESSGADRGTGLLGRLRGRLVRP